jgi:hypothetical protein
MNLLGDISRFWPHLVAGFDFLAAFLRRHALQATSAIPAPPP